MPLLEAGGRAAMTTLIGRSVPLPGDPVVHRVVERNARVHPGRLAVTCGPDSLTYRELDARADRLAGYLRRLGVRRGDLVGVCLDRSLGLMIGILGVLKAGAAYVPLDPAYPPERLRLMASQLAGMQVVLAAGATAGLVEAPATVDPTAVGGAAGGDPAPPVDGDDLCYVAFTSGSTGVPKASAVRHRGWYNMLDWLRADCALDGRASSLTISSFGFDLTQRSMMMPLFTGATAHLLPSRTVDVGMALRFVAEHRVRTVHLAPSTLYLLVDRETATGGDALAGLGHLFIGGEPINASRLAGWATKPDNGCLLLNQYGTAECSDIVTSYRLRDWARHTETPPPVGRPIQNNAVHLLDERLAPVGPGAVGEVCISGLGVGAGYLNPDHEDRFVTADPGGGPVRVFRTGDSGYATPAGELVVVGRLDHQVKVRGMRIDLGDVEHALRRHPAVRDAAVVAFPDPDGVLALAAFVIPAGGGTAGLRRDLLTTLPSSMVPQRVVEVPALPLSPNGKIDRKALVSSLLT
jgi:D-alanine--poly(phosphoribitol) ligase subunit 1